MKAPSPLLGFNNNVRHKGRVFHIQTEDSGIRHPHIITHLFADGGRILKTTKTSYAEHIGQERLAETVRAMMQEQHKAMFIALRDGQFDYLFDESERAPGSVRVPSRNAMETGAAQAPPASEPEPPATAPSPPQAELAPPIEAAAPPIEALPPPIEALPPPIEPPPPPIEPPPPSTAPAVPAAAPPRPPIPRPAPGKLPARPPQRPVAQYAPTEPAQKAADLEMALAPAARRRGTSRPTLDVDPGAIHGMGSSESSINLDLDALERAAAEAQTPFFQQIQDLPPPPAAVLGSKRAPAGGYSVRSSGDLSPTSSDPPPPPARPATTGQRANDGRTTNPLGDYDGGRPGLAGLGVSGTGSPAQPSTPFLPPASNAPTAPRTGSPDGASPRTGSPDGALVRDGGRITSPKAAPSPGRYAPSRPASIFATTRPQEGASIFGEDLISEKSLDEVILSYLAEDLDGPVEKK